MITLNTSMEFLRPQINMEFGEMDSNLGALWSPAFEDDVFNSTFVWRDGGNLSSNGKIFVNSKNIILLNIGESISLTAENVSENRRKLATELLKVLDGAKLQHDSKSLTSLTVQTVKPFICYMLSFWHTLCFYREMCCFHFGNQMPKV